MEQYSTTNMVAAAYLLSTGAELTNITFRGRSGLFHLNVPDMGRIDELAFGKALVEPSSFYNTTRDLSFKVKILQNTQPRDVTAEPQLVTTSKSAS